MGDFTTEVKKVLGLFEAPEGLGMTAEVVLPSSAAADPAKVEAAFRAAEALHIKHNMPADVVNKSYVYESNSVDYRVNHLLNAIKNNDIDVVWALRGGYGSNHVAEKIANMDTIDQHKFFVGFSDSTALGLALNQKHDWLVVHGPGFLQFEPGVVNPDSLQQTIEIVNGQITKLTLPDLVKLNAIHLDSQVTGKLTGGNLSILASSVGTNWQVDCKDKVVFIEDVNEAGYQVDRALTQLKQSGALDGVKAVVFGAFYKSDATPDAKYAIDYALNKFAAEADCPVYKTDAFGHYYDNQPLVIGADACLIDGNVGTDLHYEWSLVV